ncbi:MAG: hypothetical protein U0X86_000526 [Wolbachia endosymbiont of Xenopsylla cheopis]
MTLEGYSHTEHLEYQYLSEHKRNAFKTGAFAGTIEAAVLKKAQ